VELPLSPPLNEDVVFTRAIAAVELCLNINIKRLSNSSLDVTTSMSSLRARVHTSATRARTKKSIRHVSVNSQCPARHLISEHRNSQFFVRALSFSLSLTYLVRVC
jgi:hypothetical protein